jgi:hypothetical protein
MAQATFESNLSLYFTATFLKTNSFYTHLPAYEFENCSETLGFKRIDAEKLPGRKDRTFMNQPAAQCCSHPHDIDNKGKMFSPQADSNFAARPTGSEVVYISKMLLFTVNIFNQLNLNVLQTVLQ